MINVTASTYFAYGCFTSTSHLYLMPACLGDPLYCRSPNGVGLVHWPQYGPEEEFLALGLKQQAGKQLKRDRYVFLTQTLPEKLRAQEKHSEL